MKKFLSLTVFLFALTVIDLCASASLGNWRFRLDDGDENWAVWSASENNPITQDNESNIRLRMALSVGVGTYSDDLVLYYKEQNNDLSDKIWHIVSNDSSEAFMYSLSSYISNTDGVFKKLTYSSPYSDYTYLVGAMREDPEFLFIFMEDSTIAEFEYCIKPSPNADFEKSYLFRLADSDTTGITYSTDELPVINLKKPVLTIIANNFSRKTGKDNPALTLSYSGFVDGDDATVLSTPPKVSCSAGSTSPVGAYDIVPYGAADNKYEIVYAVGKLTVTAASGNIEYNTPQGLSIFPNPASDIIHLQGEIPVNVYVHIFDLTGRLVLEQTIESTEIDIHNLTNGAYILNVDGHVFKIIKK